MKKFIVLTIALLLIAGPAFAIDGRRQSTGFGDIMGQGNMVLPHATYRLVRVLPGENYSGGRPTNYIYRPSADMVMIWWTGTSGADGRSVAPCARVSMDSRVAGVLVTSCDISTDTLGTMQYVSDDTGSSNWGYIQTYGKTNVLIGAGVTAGDLLGCSFNITGGAAPYMPNEASGTTVKASDVSLDPSRMGVLGFALSADALATAGDRIQCFITTE
jgi:hypothetical protein